MTISLRSQLVLICGVTSETPGLSPPCPPLSGSFALIWEAPHLGHNVRYTRPETRTTIARIFVPTDEEMPRQIRRLKMLGYTIVDIDPPLRDLRPTLVSVTEMRG